MGASLNKVQLIGNLGADPEVHRTQSGKSVVNLKIATSESWKDKQTGERKEKTEWHRVVIFSEGLCKVAEQYLKKGARIFVEGQLTTRKWVNKDGHDQYSTEIVLQGYQAQLLMLDRQTSGGGGTTQSRGQTQNQSVRDDMDDDIPF